MSRPAEVPGEPSSRRWWCWAFWAFAVTLAVGLLWPNAQLPPVINRPDLVVHAVSYGMFTALLFASGLCVRPRSTLGRTWRSLRWTVLIALIFSTVTETLQGIPILKRTSAFDDWLANLSGIVLGVIIACVWMLISRRSAKRARL